MKKMLAVLFALLVQMNFAISADQIDVELFTSKLPNSKMVGERDPSFGVDPYGMRTLYELEEHTQVRLHVPVPGFGLQPVEFEKRRLHSPDAKIYVHDSDGVDIIPVPDHAFFVGKLEHADSVVSLLLTDGRVRGDIQSEFGNFSLRTENLNVTVREKEGRLPAEADDFQMTCSTELNEMIDFPTASEIKTKPSGKLSGNHLRVRFITDYKMWTDFGNNYFNLLFRLQDIGFPSVGVLSSQLGLTLTLDHFEFYTDQYASNYPWPTYSTDCPTTTYNAYATCASPRFTSLDPSSHPLIDNMNGQHGAISAHSAEIIAIYSGWRTGGGSTGYKVDQTRTGLFRNGGGKNWDGTLPALDYPQKTFLHELGHAIGAPHTFSSNLPFYPFPSRGPIGTQNTICTVMDYCSPSSTDLRFHCDSINYSIKPWMEHVNYNINVGPCPSP